MDRAQATDLIRKKFTEPFDKESFRHLLRDLLNHVDESKAQVWTQRYIKDAYKPGIVTIQDVNPADLISIAWKF